MLSKLTISNYALIDTLDISFPEQFVIITGQTGAGKSILLGALSLLLGSKADSDVICDKNRNCVVEAVFTSATSSEDWIIRRVVTPQGRSRAFINDEPTTLDELRRVTSSLIDIHSQNSQLLLADDSFQMKVLDGYASNAGLLENYSAAYKQVAELLKSKEEIDEQIAQNRKNRDYLLFQLEQLQNAKLSEGELHGLENEQLALSNAEDLKQSLQVAISALDNDQLSVQIALKEAVSQVGKAAKILSHLEPLAQRLESSRIELKDIEQELDLAQEKIVTDDSRLLLVEDRIALIYDLIRKHSVADEAELISLQTSMESDLQKADDLETKAEELTLQIAQVEKLCSALSFELHKSRVAASPKLAEILQASIRDLDMPFAQFEIKLSLLNERGPMGQDALAFQFSSAKSDQLKELSKVASGGELSRIMLCIKAFMASHMNLPTIIFDEIDTGVSGAVADKMGSMIVSMGKAMQVIAITHLPQVASKGDAHFLVFKEFDDAQAASSKIKQIEGEERVAEIARMLSGSTLSEEAMANARVLLKR